MKELDPAFLALLACPLCRGPLRLAAGGEALRCEACRKAYPIVDGIPDLLPESGRNLDELD